MVFNGFIEFNRSKIKKSAATLKNMVRREEERTRIAKQLVKTLKENKIIDEFQGIEEKMLEEWFIKVFGRFTRVNKFRRGKGADSLYLALHDISCFSLANEIWNRRSPTQDPQ